MSLSSPPVRSLDLISSSQDKDVELGMEKASACKKQCAPETLITVRKKMAAVNGSRTRAEKAKYMAVCRESKCIRRNMKEYVEELKPKTKVSKVRA